MARPPRFTTESILDAAATAAVARWREATVDDVASLLHTPANSIYYRFPSKHALFGSLWLRAIQRFQAGLLPALAHDDATTAAVDAAAHIPSFCRENPADAIAMTLYRQQDLVTLVDGPLRDEIRHVNDGVAAGMAALATRLYGRSDVQVLEFVAVACQESGYAFVRRYLRADTDLPHWIDAAVRASCLAILGLGPPAPALP